MTVSNKAGSICARLISRRFLHKNEVKELFLDENVRSQVEDLLKSVGLELVTHIYTDYVALKVCKDLEQSVFDNGSDGNQTTNINLSRGAISLLAIVWAKLILPKRQMQIERKTSESDDQMSLLKERKPIPKEELVRLEESAIRADFEEKLGGKTKFSQYSSELSRHGFIRRREGIITEGPMLDTIIDYSYLAPRIIGGCLADVVGIERSEGDKDVSV